MTNKNLLGWIRSGADHIRIGIPLGPLTVTGQGDVGFSNLAVGVLIRQLGLRFASQSDQGFFSGFVFSWPAHLETDLSSITTSVPLAVL
jgi:hypothetical protein